MATRIIAWTAGVLALCAASVGVWGLSRELVASVQPLRIIAETPHDPRAFTQGLVIRDGILFESTGLYGESTLRRVDRQTGRVELTVPLPPELFAEGITVLGDELFLVTWQNQRGYVFDRESLRFRRTFHYTGEGWGLTDDGTQLILSDGTPTLRFLDPKTAKIVRRLTVREGGRPVENLNELEFVRGEILANIWYKDRIARIDPATGTVRGWYDAGALRQRVRLADPREDVLNGIAFDESTGTLYLTGKRWPTLFAVEPAR